MAFDPMSMMSGSPVAMQYGGAILNYENQQQTNREQRQMFDASTQFNQTQSREQRDWTERMSNTAHQREVKDLQLAGLNPILSGTGGQGASSSGGSTASAPSQPNLQAPQIHLPDMMAYGVSLRALEQAQQRIEMDKGVNAATIAKSLSASQLDKASTLATRQGLLGRTMGTDNAGKAQGVLNNLINNFKKQPSLNIKWPERNQNMGDQGFGLTP